MVCPVETFEECAAHTCAPSHFTATSCASGFVQIQKRGVPFFPGIVTVGLQLIRGIGVKYYFHAAIPIPIPTAPPIDTNSNGVSTILPPNCGKL